jgi:hypothetical protein
MSEKPVRSSSSCEASTFERSRMSLMRLSRLSPARRKICTYLSCSADSGVLASRSAMPMIAFIGVRISWLMLARKSDLVRLALSATPWPACSSASTRLRSVTSRAAANTPCSCGRGRRRWSRCRTPRLLAVAGAGGQLVVGDLLLAQHQLDGRLGALGVGEVVLNGAPISSSRVQPVSASICLLTSVMMPDGSVVISASMFDSISERV